MEPGEEAQARREASRGVARVAAAVALFWAGLIVAAVVRWHQQSQHQQDQRHRLWVALLAGTAVGLLTLLGLMLLLLPSMIVTWVTALLPVMLLDYYLARVRDEGARLARISTSIARDIASITLRSSLRTAAAAAAAVAALTCLALFFFLSPRQEP